MTGRPTVIAAVAVLALTAACGSGGGAKLKVTGTVTATGPATAQQAALTMGNDLRFVPNVVNAQVGTLTLTLDNSGGVPHNLTFADTSLGHTDTVQGHSTATLKVNLLKAGTYRFTCTFHNGMDGKVVVSSSGSP